jgi:hypothetical protein
MNATLGLKRPKEDKTSELVSYLLLLAPRAHQLHLAVTGEGSYAAHKALDDFYNALPGLTDDLAEQYQGLTEKLLTSLECSCPVFSSVPEFVVALKTLYSRISMYQAECVYSEINNTLDEIKSLINSTCYKLKFLN